MITLVMPVWFVWLVSITLLICAAMMWVGVWLKYTELRLDRELRTVTRYGSPPTCSFCGAVFPDRHADGCKG